MPSKVVNKKRNSYKQKSIQGMQTTAIALSRTFSTVINPYLEHMLLSEHSTHSSHILIQSLLQQLHLQSQLLYTTTQFY